MGAEEKHLSAGDEVRTSEPLFTEEAEEEARPVVPLGMAGEPRYFSRPGRGRLPRSFVLVLALIAAAAAGAVAGYLVHSGRAPQPAAETTAAAAPEPDTPQPAASNDTETPTAEKSDARPRPEPTTRVEPERPETNQVSVQRRDAEGRAGRVREREEVKPRREVYESRAEHRHEADDEKRAGRHEDDKGEKPKARLVGTLTGRRRP